MYCSLHNVYQINEINFRGLLTTSRRVYWTKIHLIEPCLSSIYFTYYRVIKVVKVSFNIYIILRRIIFNVFGDKLRSELFLWSYSHPHFTFNFLLTIVNQFLHIFALGSLWLPQLYFTDSNSENVFLTHMFETICDISNI